MNPKYRETENTLKRFTLDQFAEMKFGFHNEMAEVIYSSKTVRNTSNTVFHDI